jgi:ELWxxDGT repeat protein
VFTNRQALWISTLLCILSIPSARSATPTVELLADIRPGIAQSLPDWLAATDGGLVYFQAHDGVAGPEGWLTDGTPSGTRIVPRQTEAGYGGRAFGFTAATGPLVYYWGDNSTSGIELWRSDGTRPGTYMLLDINPGTADAGGGEIVTIGDQAYFAATHPSYGTELWVSDGTTAGTRLVKDIDPGLSGSGPLPLGALGNRLLFRASVGGDELWVSDGTETGTFPVQSPTAYYVTLAGVVDGAMLFFHGTSGLWRTDGTVAGTQFVKDVSGALSSVVHEGRLYFDAYSTPAAPGVGRELWVSDGTAAGTQVVADINPAFDAGSDPRDLVSFQGAVWFSADDGTGTSLWMSDGTAEGTVEVADVHPTQLRVAGDLLYFTELGTVLWASDGTSAGTAPVAGSPQTVSQIVTLGGQIVFSAYDPPVGREIWRAYDGAATDAPAVAGRRALQLDPARPNPARHGTELTYSIPAPGLAALEIFDVAGRRVRVLEPERIHSAGRYRVRWDGRDERGAAVGSGVYYARLLSGPNTASRPIVLRR